MASALLHGLFISRTECNILPSSASATLTSGIETPEDFVFSLKGRFITHVKRLIDRGPVSVLMLHRAERKLRSPKFPPKFMLNVETEKISSSVGIILQKHP
jgi:uncharacterized protein YecE (DUF72 family)